MTYPTIFANLPGSPSTNPASLIDTMFNIAGGMGQIPCTASGSNAITLTPITNYYLPAAYANFQMVGFTAAASSTGAVTIRIGALAFVNLYMPTGLQANNGDIILSNFYVAAFNAALNSGSGGFQVFNASTPNVIQPVQATFKNLKITNGGTPDTQIAITADQVMLGNNSGGSAKVSTVSVTISMVSNGANGLDAGSVAQATWYALYVIYNGSTTAGLASTSFTSPTLPAGYTFFARMGAIQTGAASTNLTRILQVGNCAKYVVTAATQTPNLPIISNVQGEGSISVPTWVAKSISTFVPPTAGRILGIGQATGDVKALIIAPNNSYGAFNSITNPPPVQVSAGTGLSWSIPFDFALESTNIYTANNFTGGAQSLVLAAGWIDNI